MTHVAVYATDTVCAVPDMSVSGNRKGYHDKNGLGSATSFKDAAKPIGEANDQFVTDGFFQARTRHVEACVAQIFNIRHESIRASTRGKAQVARARQVAMYVCHTTLGYSLTAIGELFERDRTTVGHACRLVEDLRDETGFDAMIVCLERAVLAGCLATPLRGKISHSGVIYV